MRQGVLMCSGSAALVWLLSRLVGSPVPTDTGTSTRSAVQMNVADSERTSDDIVPNMGASSAGTTLTVDPDDLTGTDNDEIFRAPALELSGALTPPLQTADRAHSQGGFGSLHGMFAGPRGPPTVPVTVNLVDIATGGSPRLSAANFNDLTRINSLNRVNSLTFSDLPALLPLVLIHAKAWLKDLFADAAGARASAAMSVTSSNVAADSIELNGSAALPSADTSIDRGFKVASVTLRTDAHLTHGRFFDECTCIEVTGAT
jgi:hypothetical protein